MSDRDEDMQSAGKHPSANILDPEGDQIDVDEGVDEGEGEESAYGESSSRDSDSDYDSDEVVDEAELSDEEEEEEEEYEVEEAYEDRPRKRGRPRKYPLPGSLHGPSTFSYPAGPIMPPLIAATIPRFAKAFTTRSTGTTATAFPFHQPEQQPQTTAEGIAAAPETTRPSSPQLTAAQLQELTRSTVNQLAGMAQAPGGASGPKLPLLLPRTPEVASQIRANVSAELKQNLATMLLNPQYRHMLMQQLQAAQNPNLLHNQQPSGQFTFRQYQSRQEIPHKRATPSKGRSLALRGLDGETTGEEEGEGGTIAERRPRRTPRRTVDYKKYFTEDAEGEDDEEAPDTPHQRAPKRVVEAQQVGKRRRGRPRKSAIVDEETHDEEEVDGDVAERLSDEGPNVEKILSKRTNEEGTIEYYVKWAGLSYLHTEWITKDELVSCTRNAGTRLTRFDKKPLSEHHYSAEHVFNPAFCVPERILFGWQHPDVEDPDKTQTSYLVKWTSLPVEDSTWEKGDALLKCQDGEARIQEWATQLSAEEKLARCLPVGQRPDPVTSGHATLTESPVYKNGNTLRSYQLEGLNWLLYCWLHRQSCIIADEMGLGKTVQSVAFLDYLYNKFNVLGPFLIVAPLSTLPHWEREFEAWSGLRVVTYHGNVPGRDVQHEYEFFYRQPGTDQPIPGVCRFDVLITTYEMALAGEAHLRDIVWRVAVFDEAHRLKGKNSKAGEVLKGFQVEHKLLLTGTPLQNNLEELWALLNFLQPQRFFSEDEFREQYGQLRRSEDVQRLQALLKPLMLRRLKEDVEKSIPVKEETIVEVELTSLQKRYYRAILERNFTFLLQGAAAKNAPGLLNTMMELRKCCIHPYLIQGAENRILEERGLAASSHNHEELMALMIQASGKLVLLDKLLARLREGGHRVLIFSQMTRCLDILGDYLRYRRYPFERIDGSIRGEDRQAAIDRFCEVESDAFVFLLCTRAGGVGINLTAADTVIIYDSDWNPQNDLQAQARCHRIGQTKSVKIYRLLTRNTYEREMFDRAGLKLGLDKAVLGQKMADFESAMQHGAPAAPSAMDRKEVETLLKKGAYGLLMEDDEASVRFCEESIDQILERRTTVIRHGEEAASAKTSSIFSKASFAATADQDATADDIDIDDPMFWERWAQKMQMDPNQLLDSGRGMALLDEPRVKRSVRRIRNDAENLALREVFEAKAEAGIAGKPLEWTEGERILLLQNILDHGLSCIDTSKHPHRTRNDLLAAARFVLRECLDYTTPAVQFSGTGTPHAHDEAKFREDFEKLVIGRMDFDVIDQGAVPAEDRPVPREFPRSEIPYPYASRPQILAYKAFTDYPEDSQFAQLLSRHARSIVLRVHLFELVRQYCQLDAGTAPLVPGAGLREWWAREHDLALLQGITKHGLRSYDTIMKAEPFCTHPDLPTADELDERVLKLLSAFERRSRATAKAALTTIHEQRKRVPVFKPAAKPQRSRRRRNVSDEEEEEEVEEAEFGEEEYVDKSMMEEVEEEEAGGGRRKPSRKGDRVYKGTTKSRWTKPRTGIATRWSRRDRNEFMRVVGQFGFPAPLANALEDDPLVEDAAVKRDWTTFLRLSNFATTRDFRQLDEFAPLFVTMCRVSAEKHVVATAVESDEELAVVPADRARKSLQRIVTFGRLRSWLADPSVNFQEVLSHSRRTAGLPRWWETSTHDLALLQGIARYGTAQIPWIIGDKELAFWPIYEAAVSDTATEATSRRRSSAKQPTPSAATDDSGIRPSAINWPTEMVILRRFDQLMDIISKEASSPTATRPLTLKLSRSSTVSDLQAPETDEDKDKMDEGI